MGEKQRLLGILSISSAAVIWGSNGVIVNMISLDAFTIAFFRVFLASLILFPFMAIFRMRDLTRIRSCWKLLLLNGFLLSLGWAFLFASMKLIPIAEAVLLNYLGPVFTAILSPVILKEKLERASIAALLMSLLGIYLISHEELLHGASGDLLGIIYGLLAGLSYASFIIVSKMLREGQSSLTTAFYSYAFAAIFLAAMSRPTAPSLSAAEWILLLVLSGVNTCSAVTLYLHGLAMVEAHKAVVLAYLEPLSAAIMGAVFLGQLLGPIDILGGLLIMVSGYIVARS
jgi:drug/metabolite transporter (DMT)-like permease